MRSPLLGIGREVNNNSRLSLSAVSASGVRVPAGLVVLPLPGMPGWVVVALC